MHTYWKQTPKKISESSNIYENFFTGSIPISYCHEFSLSVCQSVSLCVCQSVSLSVCQSVSPSVFQFAVCLSVCSCLSPHIYFFSIIAQLPDSYWAGGVGRDGCFFVGIEKSG